MKFRYLAILAIFLAAATISSAVYNTYLNAPSNVLSGTSYDIHCQTTIDIRDGVTSLTLYKNGSYYASNSSYGDYYMYLDVSAIDYGAQYVYWELYAEDGLWNDYMTAGVEIYEPNRAPVGHLEGWSSGVFIGESMTATGWAVDYEMGAPIDRVEYFIDGSYAGRAYLWGYRPDIQMANISWGFWSPKDVTWSGWSIEYDNTASLAIGPHTLRVVVWDNQGLSWGSDSYSFVVVRRVQEISFTNPGVQTYGTPCILNASASSGLPVSYTITGPAYLSGNIVYFTGPGSITVTASQVGNSGYNAAANVSQTFTVNQMTQSITFACPSTQTADGVLTLSASSSSGLLVSYWVTGPASLSGNTVYFNGAGTVSITASQAGNTYYAAAPNVVQSFVVNPSIGPGDPNGDDDGDGIPNRVEALLGTNRSSGTSTENSNSFKVHKP